MPMYDVKCTCCKHTEEVYARMSETDALACSKCGKPVEIVPPRTVNGNRHFAGSEMYSVMEGWPKKEVPEARRLMGDFGHCIQDNGRVKFSSRQEQIGYVRKVEQLEAAAGIADEPDPD